MTMSSQDEGYRGHHEGSREHHVTSRDGGQGERHHTTAHLSAKTRTKDSSTDTGGRSEEEGTSKQAHSSSHHRSREPSSGSRGEEEPSSSKTRDASVETVDRGVGPTPAPPPSHVDPRSLPHPYYLPSSFIDPRNGLEQANPYSANPYGIPGFPYYHVPYPINPPLPLNAQTLEGRYNWPPPPPGFHHPMPGLPASPSHTDVSSLYGLRSPMAPSESVTALASRIHWEQLRQNYLSPVSGRRYSPGSLPGRGIQDYVALASQTHGMAYPWPTGVPFGSSGGTGYPSDYPTGFSPYGARSMFTDVPPTPGSGSVTLPGSIENSSRQTSPRHSIITKSRKRALSHSPISDYLDIQSLTRSSEGSLQLTPLLGAPHSASRSSSAASGSYGHLSAASLGALSPANHPQMPSNPYLRPGANFPAPPFFHPGMPQMMGRLPPGAPLMMPSTSQPHTVLQPQPQTQKPETQSQISTTTKEAGSSVVSSTVEAGYQDMKRTKIKAEKDPYHHHHHHHHHPSHSLYEGEEGDEGDEKPLSGDTHLAPGHVPQEGEPDFMETNCHWEDCSKEFDTQEELVKHINQDHIQANKKAFVCRWSECSREEKPFKAQYMLVVHMRRHTGEKPHRCTFEGCMKAYSRLENLKTHLRSHTGEKPYMCEFPGCTKAFSNASDRAKHQNRTHSNAKPYICKAPGCTKRYTDPSSLRKHVKTVHGPEFYANKKHKGDIPQSCKLEKKDENEQHQDDSREEGTTKVEECMSVGPLQTSSGDRRSSQDNVGSVIQQHPSPQSSPEVNVTNNLQSEMDDHMTSGSQVIAVGQSGGMEEDADVPEPDEAEVPGSDNLVVMRQNRLNTSRTLQKRNLQKNLALLPPVGHNRARKEGGGHLQTSLTDLKPPAVPNHSKRITDLHSGGDSHSTNMFRTRRDSNTSTLSSYYSSLRSDNSPNPFGSLASSRRSSELSTNRLSITNSPYEYDITGNRPYHSRRSCNSDSSANMSHMEAQFQKTNLGSQPNLQSQSNSVNSSMHSPSSKYQQERIARFLAARQDMSSARNSAHSTPCRTPLPNEMPNKDARRASDPVRAMDPNFNGALKQLQRFHSLNMGKPLPVPQGRSLRHKSGSRNTFNSSRSSIATDPDHSNGEFDSQIMDTDTEAALEEKMLEDNEDMIIPDDMRRFLNERYGDGHSLYSYDPNALTESEIFYLQQGACGANSNNQTGGSFVQHSHDGSSGGNQFSANNSVQGMQTQNFYNSNSGMPNKENINYNMNPNMENMQMNSPGHMTNNMPPDQMLMQHQLSRENTAAWVQRQNAQNLPQSQGMFPPVTPTQEPNVLSHGNMPPPKPKDRNMNPNVNWNMMNANMQHMNSNNQNMHPMMHSPIPPNMPAPHPPLTPKSGHSMNHPHYPVKMNQMHPNQTQMMQNQMMQGHIPHPPSTKLERGSPQVQVPHISQSQIPPRAKAANRNQMMQQQQQSSEQQQQQQMGPPNQNALMTMQGNNFPQKMYGGYCGPMNMPQQTQQQQYLNPQYNNMNMQLGPMNNQEFNPNCQQSTQDHRSPFSKLEMSPGCNQVTSSTDVVAERPQETEAPPIENFMDNLNSISAENFMDNINSISQENMNNMYSPTAMSNRSNSQASRYSAALMNTSNMVVNDMSSTMLQLAEENKYFSRRQ